MSNLSKDEISALHDALDDEYKAWATYDQVIQDFGSIRPFINIRESESRYIDALLQIFRDYELIPPDNNWVGKVPRFESVKSACAAAVQGEIERTPTVVYFTDLARGKLAVLEIFRDGLVECFSQNCRLVVVSGFGDLFKRWHQRAVLAE